MTSEMKRMPTFKEVMENLNIINLFVDTIPARYYCPEDGVSKRGMTTTEAVSRMAKQKSKKAPVHKHSLGHNQLREKLQERIREARLARTANPENEGRKRKRGEKRAQVEDVSYPNFVKSKDEDELKRYEEPMPGTKRKVLEKDIRNIERSEQKLKSMENDKERAEKIHAERMEKALQRAGGAKIMDDVSKLKKTLKHKEKKKGKGHEAWKGRVDDVAKKNADRQAKRKDNIQKYRTSKKTKRRNGFEGQKGSGFLNKDKEV